MKEATGELNMALVVVISVGVLATFFFTVLWPQIKGNFSQQTDCNRAVCDCGAGLKEENGVKYCTCKLKNSDQELKCVYKG